MKIEGKVIPKYGINPFALNIKAFRIGQRIQRISSKNKLVVIIDKKTGKMKAEKLQNPRAVIGVRKYVDKEEYVKVSAEGMAAMLNLSPAGKRIFELIYKQIAKHKGTDRVILHYQPDHGISKMTWYKGLKECLEYKIIAQSDVASVYFTNINYYR